MLLDYAILTAPNPLQAGAPATLTLAISNGGSHVVNVTKIVVTLPIGTNAKDLTASAGFQTDPPPGWNVSASGGVLTLTPQASGAVGRDGLALTISDVAVNDQPGTAPLPIDETAAVANAAPVTSRTSLAAAKFPVQFSVSELVVTPPQVAFGGSASVMWTGTPATYTLQYPGSGPLPTPVSNVGPFEATNLTIFPAVVTLTVSLAVPGQDAPLVTERQATAELKPQVGISRFSPDRPRVTGGDTLGLSWQVQLATSLTLQLEGLPGSVDVTGLSGCAVAAKGSPPLVVSDAQGKQLGTLTPTIPFPQFLTFVLTASDGSSFPQATLQVEVLPPSVSDFDVTWCSRMEGEIVATHFYLNWSTANANPVTVDRPPVFSALPPSGSSMEVYYSVTYTLSATGFGATVSRQAIADTSGRRLDRCP
jgi:hypothetical protein